MGRKILECHWQFQNRRLEKNEYSSAITSAVNDTMRLWLNIKLVIGDDEDDDGTAEEHEVILA